MKEAKKLIALLLVTTLSFSLAACGGKTPANGDNKTDPTKAPTKAAEETADVYPAFDMGGKTIQIAQWFEKYYDSNHTKIDDNPNVVNAETAQMQLDNLRRIEKKYNVKIDFVTKSWDGMKESINTSIAAGTPEMDIYTTDLQFGIPAVANGLAIPIKEYAPKYSDVMNKQVIVRTLETLGETYLFAAKGLETGGVLCYNADLIKALGLEDPQALYEKGEWTFDKFAEYAKLATKDTDGDGTMDQYGLSGVYGTNLGFIYANNGNLASGAKEEMSSTNVMEAFEFLNKLYNVDKSAVFFQETDNTWDENLYAWTNGNILFWGGAAWILGNGKTNYGVEFEYHVVPYPRGPHGDGTATGTMGGHWYMIPKGIENADKIYQVYEEYLNWFNFDTDYIYDTEGYEQYFQSEKDIEIAAKMGEGNVLDYSNYVGFNIADPYNAITTGQMTVSQAIETYKPVLQQKLDEVLKQNK